MSPKQVELSVLALGSEFAGYRVEAVLGRQSGIGRVYEATSLDSGERVALKVFRGLELDRAAVRTHFKRTAEAQAQLSHPGVVAVHDWGLEPAPFLVMTLVRGTTLAEMLSNGRQRGLPALEMLGAVAEGLDAAREQGLVYRRLQPAGVLVGEDGTAQLGDFGAGRGERAVELLDKGSLGAYADYIAPEEIDGGETSPAGNVYALGAMAYHVLAGHPPFASEYEGVSLRAHLDAPPRGPGSERRGLSARLDQAVVRALSKDPALRQPSARELMDAVMEAFAESDAAQGEPSRERAPAATAADARRRWRPRPLTALTALLALLAVVAAGALGAAAAGGEDAPRAPEPARSASTGDVRLSHPANWRVARQAPRIAGLRVTDPVALVPPRGSVELVAGRAEGAVPGDRGRLVDLGGVIGRRYAGLRETGSGRRAVAYVVPGANGAAVAACVGAGSRAVRATCERVASTVRPRREGTALAAASPAYARAVSSVVRRLERVRVKGRRRLARARTPAGQRRITARLYRDYTKLTRALARIEAPGPARAQHRVALGQLRRASRGYRDMSRAARARSGRRWVAARAGVRSAEGRVNRALARLRAQGYRVR